MAIKKFNTIAGLTVGDIDLIDVIDDTGNVTATNLTARGISNLGPVGNIRIAGGNNGYILQTDGLGNLQWTTPTNAAGGESQIQFNKSGNFTGSPGLTFDDTANILIATAFSGDGFGLTNINGAEVNGEVQFANYATWALQTINSDSVTGSNQPYITSVGNLTQLVVQGTAEFANAVTANNIVSNSSLLVRGDATILGNLTVSGNSLFTDVTTLVIKDPIIELGGYPNGDPLAVDDGADRGTLLHYYTSNAATDAFMGWDNSNAEFTFASNASVVNNSVVIQHLGNLRASSFIGSGALLTSINGANVSEVANAIYAETANLASTVTTSYQPNITSVGELTELLVVGDSTLANVTADKLTVGTTVIELGNVTSTYFIGDLIGNISGPTRSPGANTSIIFNDGGVLGTSTNFTFVTSTSTLAVTGNIEVTSKVTASLFQGSGANLANINGANVSEVANANFATTTASALVAVTVTSSNQPNITSIGTLTSLTVGPNSNIILSGTTGFVRANSIQGPDGTTSIFNGYGNSPGSVGIGADLTVGSGNLIVNGNSNLGNVANANYFIGDGSNLSAISGANVTGTVANAAYSVYAATANISNIAGTVTTNAQPNITSVGTLVELVVSGSATLSNLVVTGDSTLGNTATANYFVGDGSNLSSLTGANVTGRVANAIVAGTVYTNAQPNITSVGTLTRLDVTNDITASSVSATYLIGNGSNLSDIIAANIVGVVANANYASFSGAALTALTANTVIENAQPNITSVGTLTSLIVSGNIVSTNITGNVVTANFFVGDGSNLTSITGGNVTGIVPDASHARNADAAIVAGAVTTNAQPNITSVGTLTDLSVFGNVTSAYFVGDGSNLSNINGANVSQVANANYAVYSSQANTATYAFEAGTIRDNAQPNITSVGTLTSLSISGNLAATRVNVSENLLVSGDATIAGNLTINGTTVYTDVTSVKIKDPIVEQGGGANGATLTSNDGKDRGQLLHYFDVSPVDAFMGWDNSNAEFAFASNVTVSNDVTTFNDYGNLRVKTIYGNLNGSVTGDVYLPGNDTEVVFNDGSIAKTNANFKFNKNTSELTVVGNVVATTVSATTMNATTFYGNLVGNVSRANTVILAAQPNITSVGNLTSLNVVGTITAADVQVSNTVTSNSFVGLVTTSAQPNITSVGNLVSLNVTGNITSGNANLGNLATANFFSGNGSSLFAINGANVSEVPNAIFATNASLADLATVATTAVNVTSSSQPNITSVGILSNLAVTGAITAGSLRTDELLFSDGTPYSFNAAGLTAAGANTQVIFNTNTKFGASPNFTFSTATNTLTATNIFGTREIAGQNVVACVSMYSNGTSTARYNVVSEEGNIVAATGYLIGQNADLGNIATSNYFRGNGSQLTGLNASNINGTVANASYADVAGSVLVANMANYAGNITVNSQPNITSVGTLIDLTVAGGIYANSANITGNVSATYFTGNGSYLLNLTGAAVVGYVPLAVQANLSYKANVADLATVATLANTATVALNVTQPAQPNITSIGTLTSLVVTGNITAGAASFANSVSALYFVGDAGNLTNINPNSISGPVPNAIYSDTAGLATLSNTALVAGSVTASEQRNITSVGTLLSLTVSGSTIANTIAANTITLTDITMSAGNITATNFIGNLTGAVLGNITSPGSNTAVIFNDAGNLGAVDALQFTTDTNTLSITGNLSVTSNITRNGRTVPTYVTASSSPANAVPGDEWYDTSNDILYKRISDGSTQLWIDITSSFINSDVTAFPDTLVLRDANASIQANVGTMTTAKIKNIVGNNSNIAVSSNTVIDSFSTESFRTAKYIIKAGSDTGYQSVEALLIHDGSNSFVTVYGSISTIADDIITITSNISSGNVCLYATTIATNTRVNIIGTYVTD